MEIFSSSFSFLYCFPRPPFLFVQILEDNMAEDCLHRTPIVHNNAPQTGRDSFRSLFLQVMHSAFEGSLSLPFPMSLFPISIHFPCC